MKRTAMIAHAINAKHNGNCPKTKKAITALLLIAQGKDAKMSKTEATKLVKKLAAIGEEKGWTKNAPADLLKLANKGSKQKATSSKAAAAATKAANAPLPTTNAPAADPNMVATVTAVIAALQASGMLK